MAKLPTYKANMLSRAATLELIASVVFAIHVYYMSNTILLKFFAKLIFIIAVDRHQGEQFDYESLPKN